MNEKALSIRQPWAWLIVQGFKDVENRVWRSLYRGPVLIHAAKGMTRDEYYQCQRLAGIAKIKLPPIDELPRGGIVGQAEIVECVSEHHSFWFTGPYCFVLRNAKVLPFAPCKGHLGFFEARYPGTATYFA